jgi:hypothetical protein
VKAAPAARATALLFGTETVLVTSARLLMGPDIVDLA